MKNRARPTKSKDLKLSEINFYGESTLIKFEKSKPGLEWLAKNWRRHKISNIDSSPSLVLLSMYLEDHKILPSVREIMNGLIMAQKFELAK